MTTSGYTSDFSEVLADERRRIDAQRAKRGVGSGWLVGLALSGGGIRAAAFGIGALQALQERGALRRIDYLSTVSGGGYAGAALTWFRRHGAHAFPFEASTIGGPLDFIRRHASYLKPARSLSLLSLMAVVLQQMVLSGFVYGSLLIGFFFLLNVLDRAVRPIKAIAGLYADDTVAAVLLPSTNVAGLVGLVLAATFVLSALWASVRTFVHRLRRRLGPDVQRRDYEVRLRTQRRATTLLRWAVAAFVIGSVPTVSLLLTQWVDEEWTRGAMIGTVTTVAGLLASLGLRRGGADHAGGFAAALRTFGVPVLAVIVLYGLLLLGDTLAIAIVESSAVWLILVVVGVGLVLGLTADLNSHGSHRVYRDRLMETFLPDEAAVRDGLWRPAWEATGFPLAECCSDPSGGPYHLLNASLTALSSDDARYRGRGADSFVLSPLYCGGTATGWTATSGWQRGTMTLVAATAISAAAADPHTAAAGHGATRGSLISMLLAVLDLRLGDAARNPNPRDAGWAPVPPNMIRPGNAQNLLGSGLCETRPYIELADGGDFDDLGIYELVRRRVEVIVAADASQDPGHGFAALGDVLQRVRSDFGVTITFDDGARGLSDLLHGSAGYDVASRAYDLTRRSYAVGRIRYPARNGQAATEGVLLYVKATLFAGLPADVLAYKAAHPAFPHESTLDQLFDDAKFDAYRELGRAAVHAMLADDAAAEALELDASPTAGTAEPLRIGDPSGGYR